MAVSETQKILQPLSVQLSMNAHQAAPQEIKSFFKLHISNTIGSEQALLDLSDAKILEAQPISALQKSRALAALDLPNDEESHVNKCYSISQIPGLIYAPNVLSPMAQKGLLDRLLHRDLSNPAHQTNLHGHYEISYPSTQQSFFERQSTEFIKPKDPTAHKPLTIQQTLNSKLRWVTLGGQYNWTEKLYPAEKPPEFPLDVASLVHHLFPTMEPQAAIVNLYTPGDRLNMHRDVSEEIDIGLVSVSIGCSCIFIVGIEDEVTGNIQKVAVRLKSGDAVLMGGKSRLAWHGVARVEKGTCPNFLKEWPGDGYPNWKGWMENKRINLNVRQMRETELNEDGYL